MKGHVDPAKPTLVRMHALNMFTDAFAEEGGGMLGGAMRAIAEEGAGIVVIINRPVPGGLARALDIRAGKARAEEGEQLRDYGVGAQILLALGVHEMILLTNSHHTPVALGGYGLEIVEERPIPLEAN